MRICNNCKKTKTFDSFYRKNTGKSGRVAVCRECHAGFSKTAALARPYSGKLNTKPPKKTPEELIQYKLSRPRQNMLSRAKARAKKFGLLFDIGLEDIEIPRFCPILGIELIHALEKKGNLERGRSPSLDRIDNSKGYVRGNIIVVSHRANCIKRDATILELQRIADFYTRLEARSLLTDIEE